MKMHLIMPMGGRGSRFAKNGIEIPKPLITLNGKPFFYWSVESINRFIDVDITFVVLKEHIDSFGIDKEIKKYFKDAKIVVIPEVLNGAVLTCLEGVKEINDNLPILFNDCDHMFKSNEFNKLVNEDKITNIDGLLLTFKSNEPKYSFIAYDEKHNVTKTVEKQVISNDAICGAYYFKNKDIFIEGTEQYLKECAYKEYFVSGVYNSLIKQGKIIKAVNCDFHIPYGVPEEYEIARNSNKFEELN